MSLCRIESLIKHGTMSVLLMMTICRCIIRLWKLCLCLVESNTFSFFQLDCAIRHRHIINTSLRREAMRLTRWRWHWVQSTKKMHNISSPIRNIRSISAFHHYHVNHRHQHGQHQYHSIHKTTTTIINVNNIDHVCIIRCRRLIEASFSANSTPTTTIAMLRYRVFFHFINHIDILLRQYSRQLLPISRS